MSDLPGFDKYQITILDLSACRFDKPQKRPTRLCAHYIFCIIYLYSCIIQNKNLLTFFENRKYLIKLIYVKYGRDRP